jgi:hypothetical protein
MEPYERLKAPILCVSYNSLTFAIAKEQTWYDPFSSISLNSERNVCKVGFILVLLRRGSIFRLAQLSDTGEIWKYPDRYSEPDTKWQNLILRIFCVWSCISFASLTHIWCRWHKRAGFLLRRVGFNTSTIYMAFMEGKFAVRQVPSTYSRLLLPKSSHECSIGIHSSVTEAI